MSIVSKGFNEGNIVARGFGRTLLIIIEDEPLERGYPIGLVDSLFLDKKVIKTRRVKVPFTKKEIFVDVILINLEELEEIKILVKELGYSDIKIFLKEEVKILD